MTAAPDPGFQDRGLPGLVPRPDPTVLTNEAVARVETSLRREIAGQREILEDRIASLDRALSRRMDDAGKAVDAALASAEKAVSKAETASERRFEGVNEFRKALADQTGTFVARGEYLTALKGLEDRLGTITERLNSLELRITSRLDQGESTVKGAGEYRTERRADSNLAWMGASVLIGFLALALALYAALHR